MRYVALLRGINVGGKNPVPMAELKSEFEAAGHSGVRTYINSGNVVFDAPRAKATTLAADLEARLGKRYPFQPRVLVLRGSAVVRIAADLPQRWLDDDQSSCNVLYLWPQLASPRFLDRFELDPDLEEMRYSHGAVLSRVSRPHLNRSAYHKFAGTELVRQVTIRNANTARKLAALVEAQP